MDHMISNKNIIFDTLVEYNQQTGNPLDISDSPPIVSIIVVAYNMQREIPRTILSLSKHMQLNVHEIDYEIILVDNGSTIPFDRTACTNICHNLIIVDNPDPKPSPAGAINFGLTLAKGSLIGVIIDGARMASPGLISTALMAASISNRAIISPLAFHLGNKVQSISITEGYDEYSEDKLLESVEWETNGYRLFEISVFAHNSAGGWFEPIAESNSLFMNRQMWEELGGYDEQFTSPGGGRVNHDTYKRACELTGSQLIVLLGEGSFHQIHGGVSTNTTNIPLEQFDTEYKMLRGKSYERPIMATRYIGYIQPEVLYSIKKSAEISINRR